MLRKLTASPRSKVWGRTQLGPWFPDSQEKTGEVWFEGSTIPLLVKFLFTSEKLSVQVHPPGKTEMWHILAAEPGAQIAAGFREPISEDRLRASAVSGEIMHLLAWHDARPGDTFFIPTGTVHAIGEGLVLCEIQQPLDVTYRLYDYGRPRELHIEESVRFSHLTPHAARQAPRTGVLVDCPYFRTEKLDLSGSQRMETTGEELWIALDGSGTIGGEPFRAGEVWQTSGVVELSGAATFLRTAIPV